MAVISSCFYGGCLSESTSSVSVYKFSIETDVFMSRQVVILRKQPTVYELYIGGTSSFGNYNKRGDTLILTPFFVLDSGSIYSPESYTRENPCSFFINYPLSFIVTENQLIDITDYHSYGNSVFVKSLPELDRSLIQSAVLFDQYMPYKVYSEVGKESKWYRSSGIKEPILGSLLAIYRSVDTLERFIILRDSKVFELYAADGSEHILGYWKTDESGNSANTVVLIPCLTYYLRGQELIISEISSSTLSDSGLQWTYRITHKKMVEINNGDSCNVKRHVYKRLYK